MLNKTILIGRLTDDPELRYTANGNAVANFSLAVERSYGDDTDFIDIVVWRKQAETCSEHLGKGRLVAVDGRIQMRTYETDEGYTRRVFEVVANDVRFLDYPSDSKDDNQNQEEPPENMADEEDLDVPF